MNAQLIKVSECVCICLSRWPMGKPQMYIKCNRKPLSHHTFKKRILSSLFYTSHVSLSKLDIHILPPLSMHILNLCVNHFYVFLLVFPSIFLILLLLKHYLNINDINFKYYSSIIRYILYLCIAFFLHANGVMLLIDGFLCSTLW